MRVGCIVWQQLESKKVLMNALPGGLDPKDCACTCLDAQIRMQNDPLRLTLIVPAAAPSTGDPRGKSNQARSRGDKAKLDEFAIAQPPICCVPNSVLAAATS